VGVSFSRIAEKSLDGGSFVIILMSAQRACQPFPAKQKTGPKKKGRK
jgi:hypothetical protein